MNLEQTHIAVFCKAPVAGRVKTRLIAAYGAQGAANIYTALAEKTLATVAAARETFGMSASLWVADDAAHATVQRWSAEHALPTYTQQGEDLGARMSHCLQTMHAAGFERALLIGTDCPAFTPEHLRAAATALSPRCPWVFTPSEDGGYVLVGTVAPDERAFSGIAWSTDAVMAQTRDALRHAGLAWAEMATLWDVDEPTDVMRARDAGLL